ncbi:MAG: hypothetical protein JW728_00790 [Candidatus Aureabacteria bacterium]|nr:hypothetical protein [Candidatus Auribacterota bacterium]
MTRLCMLFIAIVFTVCLASPCFSESISFQSFEEDQAVDDNNSNEVQDSGDYFYDQWYSNPSFEDTNPHTGKRAVIMRSKNPGDHGGTIGVYPSKEFKENVQGKKPTKLSVWVYDKHGDNTIELKILDAKGSYKLWSNERSQRNRWTKITWDINGLIKEGLDPNTIEKIELYEWSDGEYIFDDVTLE